MPLVPIDDLADSRIAVYRHLKASNETRRAGVFVLEGEKLFDRLLVSAHFPMVSALASDRRAERLAAKMPADLPLFILKHEHIHELVGYDFHLGVLCCARRVAWPGVEQIASALLATGRVTLVACPAVNDPENLGAIARLGDCFGVDAILAGPDCPDPLSRRVLRVSMGAVLRLPVLAEECLDETLDRLHADWRVERVAAVAAGDAEPLDRFERPDRLALVLGNEAQGLAPQWVARCERRLTIPMRQGADSLNVAVAAGIILYHLCRERGEMAM